MTEAQTLDLALVPDERSASGMQMATQAPAPAALNTSASIARMIERVAADPSIDIERMDRLFTFLERIKAAEAKEAYTADFAAMQAELPSIDANGRIVHESKNQNEPAKLIAKYAKWEDINDAIKPILARHNFVLSFSSDQPDGRVAVTAILRHTAGHEQTASLSLPLDTSGGKSNPHAIGSSMSYGKRYTAGLVLNLSSRAKEDADDDGKAAGSGGVPLITEDQLAHLRQRIMDEDVDLPKFLARIKCERLEDIYAKHFDDVVRLLNQRKADKEIKARKKAEEPA